MEKSPREIVFEGMELLPDALIPFVEKRLDSTIRGHWQPQVAGRINATVQDGKIAWDQQALLKAMKEFWKDAFAPVLGKGRELLPIVSELLDVRNKISHYAAFSCDDAERALDSMHRLLGAAGANPQAEQIRKMRDQILREKYGAPPPPKDHQARPQSAPAPHGPASGRGHPAPTGGDIYERILAFVRESPGRTQLEIAWGVFDDPNARQQWVNQDIRYAVSRGDLIQRGRGGPGDLYRYWPPNAAPPDTAQTEGNIYERILAFVREHPGRTQLEIARGVFDDPKARQQWVNQDIRYAVSRGDLIQRGRGGPGDLYRYWPPNEAPPDTARTEGKVYKRILAFVRKHPGRTQ
ncbi:MAG: hypothetical protein GDA52_04950 [Rhodobacteraceae bacterium]|nr:hypothetical protein [Paracoccaceae bacterium]